jgi:hypothetical protein
VCKILFEEGCQCLNTINILQIALSLQNISIKHINIKINVYFWQPGFKKGDYWNANRTHPFLPTISMNVKVILHQFWVKKRFPWKFIWNTVVSLLKDKTISLCNLNIPCRHLRNKIDFLNDFAEDFDILLLTETHLSSISARTKQETEKGREPSLPVMSLLVTWLTLFPVRTLLVTSLPVAPPQIWFCPCWYTTKVCLR